MVWEDLVFHSLQNIPKGRNSLQNSMVLQEKQKKNRGQLQDGTHKCYNLH